MNGSALTADNLYCKKGVSIVYLDPRVKLLQVLFTGVFTFSIGSRVTGVVLFAVSLLFLLMGGKLKTGMKILAIYLGLSFLSSLVPAGFGSMIEVFWLRMLTLITALVAFYSTTQVSELISALRKMHLPQVVVVSLAVTLRFFPSIRQDLVYIRQGMKTRGLKLSLRRPAQLYEGFVVPLLMRVLATASELSASAETRGISSPEPKTSFVHVRMRPIDVLAVAVLTVGFAILATLK